MKQLQKFLSSIDWGFYLAIIAITEVLIFVLIFK